MGKNYNPNQNNFGKQFMEMQKIINRSGPVAASSYGLITSILIFTYFGWYIDKLSESTPIGTLTGLFIGLTVGFYHLYKIIYRKK